MTGVEGRSGSSEGFASALEDLGSAGRAFLLAADAPSAVHERACERWLGAPDADHRSLVVTTGGPGAHGHATRTLAFGSDVRGATAATDSVSTRPHATTLADLGDEVLDAVADLEAGALDGDLRVCVDGLLPLQYAADEETAFRFLCLLVNRVRAADALAHVHLQAPRDGPAARLYEPLFDGTVGLRVVDGDAQERWHLADPDVDSGWVPLGDATDL